MHFYAYVFCAQVFIQGNAEECGRVLKTILEERRLCPLISPFFTPNAAPDQLVFLYQDVVTSLHLDSADVIFMLLTKVCQDSNATHWWNIMYTQKSPLTIIFSLVCSLTCLSGWMKLIPCFRREPVCWSWFMELSASAAKTLSPNFRRLFIFLPNTGHGFYATIFLTTTVTVYGCSWRVRLYLSAYVTG